MSVAPVEGADQGAVAAVTPLVAVGELFEDWGQKICLVGLYRFAAAEIEATDYGLRRSWLGELERSLTR